MTADMIKETSGLLTETSKLGENGVVLFSILVVTIMFLFAVYVAYKSQKDLTKTLMDNHFDNEKRIDEAHDRIHNLETRENECLNELKMMGYKENKCLEELSDVTSKLSNCIERLEKNV